MVTKQEVYENTKMCPLVTVFNHLGKKWTVSVLGNIVRGKSKFSDLLRINKGISTKVLSQRLKELENEGFIEKIIVSKTPLKIEYHATDKGDAFSKALYEITMFSFEYYTSDVFKAPENFNFRDYSGVIRDMYGISHFSHEHPEVTPIPVNES